MDRFEVLYMPIPTTTLMHLHSSMDRFEAFPRLYTYTARGHLHSSMDRFEVLPVRFSLISSAIYIPVWIDLKIAQTSLAQIQKVFTFQYG